MKNTIRFGVPAALLSLGGSAMAAMPAGVDAAITDLSANAVSVATTVLLAVVAVFAIKFIRKGL
jgi:hypothetical protein